MMRKVLVTAVVAAMVCSMAGCGSSKKAETTASSAASAAESAVSEAASAAADAASEAAAAVTDAVSEAEAAAADVVSEASAAVEETVSAVEELTGGVAAAAEDALSEAASAAEAAVVVPVEDIEVFSGVSAVESMAEEVSSDTGAMTYADYAAADIDTFVVVETYVQAKQSWWEDKATLYTQDEDGAYFAYNIACTQEEYDQLVEGQKIVLSGYKSEWEGEVEITDAVLEIVDGNYIAPAEDVTDLLGTDELIEKQNRKVTFKGMTVEAISTGDDSAVESVAEAGADQAFLYNWDGSGQEGDDLYFNASCNGQTYSFVVESYLCDSSSDVYKAVKELKVGDKIDIEGFLYWYHGAQPHITSVTAAA